MRYAILQIGLGCLLLNLVGCQSHHPPSIDDEPKLPTRVEGASDRVIKKLYGDLNKQGVHIITIGQNNLISIPSAMLFADQSPRLRWESFAVLNDVVCYMQQFRKISVQVNAFSSKYVSNRREHALTLARAREVANYLWSQGIDSRFIFTHGQGSDKPIIAFAKRGDVSQNSRIEITFRNAVG